VVYSIKCIGDFVCLFMFRIIMFYTYFKTKFTESINRVLA
jgi:hypothetical protein